MTVSVALQSLLAEDPKMRACFLFFAAATACTTAAVNPTNFKEKIEILISRDANSDQPAVLITIINNTNYSICIRTDALRNPYSYEMDLKLRNRTGRLISYNEPGYIDEPLEGAVRLEPGSSAEGRTYLYPRFKLPHEGKPFPNGMTVKASFPYNHCDLPLRLQASSRWQPV